MDNYNEQTGIRYGVMDARNAHYTTDDAFGNWENISYNAWREEISRTLAAAIHNALDDTTNIDTDQAREFADEIIGNLDLERESDEDTLEEKTEDHHYQISYLGGAPLLWTLASKYATRCRSCSPCCPGAGDLDHPDKDGTLTHCPDPDTLNERWIDLADGSYGGNDLDTEPYYVPVGKIRANDHELTELAVRYPYAKVRLNDPTSYRRFTLMLWETPEPDDRVHMGRFKIGYHLTAVANETIALGEDFQASPLHAIDSPQTVAALLDLLAHGDAYATTMGDILAELARTLDEQVTLFPEEDND